MERINKIIANPKYHRLIMELEKTENERRFCRHDMNHFLDVARIAYIIALEEGLEISREMIYAAGMLHDIGRLQQYEDGTPHESASAFLAEEIMKEAGFGQMEINEVCGAILAHRNKQFGGERDLNSIIYEADKLSRGCYYCAASGECKWSDAKKNEKLTY